MTEAERERIFMQWDLFSTERRNQFLTAYLLHTKEYSQKSWLNYLKEQLNSEDCWSKVGHT